MGRGTKRQRIQVPKKSLQPSSALPGNFKISARNLRVSDLGGMIFGCKHETKNECLRKQIFGLTAPHFSYVKNVKPGLPLFLFNYSDRKLHGIYEAASHGHLNIGTQFPAQVRILVKTQCLPLDEKLYSGIIKKNYYRSHYFWFELDHEQTKALLAVFKPLPAVFKPLPVPFLTSKKELVPASPSNKLKTLATAEWTNQQNSKPSIGFRDAINFTALALDDCSLSNYDHAEGDIRVPDLDCYSDLAECSQKIVQHTSGTDVIGEREFKDTDSVREVDWSLNEKKFKQLASHSNIFEALYDKRELKDAASSLKADWSSNEREVKETASHSKKLKALHNAELTKVEEGKWKKESSPAVDLQIMCAYASLRDDGCLSTMCDRAPEKEDLRVPDSDQESDLADENVPEGNPGARPHLEGLNQTCQGSCNKTSDCASEERKDVVGVSECGAEHPSENMNSNASVSPRINGERPRESASKSDQSKTLYELYHESSERIKALKETTEELEKNQVESSREIKWLNDAVKEFGIAIEELKESHKKLASKQSTVGWTSCNIL